MASPSAGLMANWSMERIMSKEETLSSPELLIELVI